MSFEHQHPTMYVATIVSDQTHSNLLSAHQDYNLIVAVDCAELFPTTTLVGTKYRRIKLDNHDQNSSPISTDHTGVSLLFRRATHTTVTTPRHPLTEAKAELTNRAINDDGRKNNLNRIQCGQFIRIRT